MNGSSYNSAEHEPGEQRPVAARRGEEFHGPDDKESVICTRRRSRFKLPPLLKRVK
jgi:hypothetical protein